MGKNKIKISIIGSGNLAWHLASAFSKANYELEEIYSRNQAAADKLRNEFFKKANQNLDFSGSVSKFFFLAVPDKAILSIASQIILPKDAFLISTSGTLPLLEITKHYMNAAVFYPLQTFTKYLEVDFNKVPVLLEFGNQQMRNSIYDLASSVSGSVYTFDSDERKEFHLAAVLTNNFANHLLNIAEQHLKMHNLNFALLKPLMEETVRKAFEIGPAAAQTGPAKRNDHQTLKTHLQRLAYNKNFQDLYHIISQQISGKPFN